MILQAPPPLVFPKPAIIRHELWKPSPAILARTRFEPPLVAFLPGLFPASLLTGDQGGPVCTFQTTGGSSTSTTSPSVASLSIGAASSDRYVIVGINSISNTGANPISAVTIGGVSATVVKQLSPGTTSDFNSGACAIAIANVPTGTTATVAWTVASTSNAHSVVVWTATGLSSATPTSTAAAGSGSPMALTLASITAGGFAVACDLCNHSGVTFTWAQLTTDGSFATPNTVPFTGAHKAFATAQTNLAVTVTQSDGTAGAAAAAAFF